MDFKLTAEQKLVQDMVRKFSTTELEPVAAEIDKEARFPEEIIKKLSELGILGIVIPEKYEGAALDALSYCLIIEGLAKVSSSVAGIVIANNAFVAYPILKYGTEEQKSRWLPSLARGEVIGAFAPQEDGSDTETAEVKKAADKYVISGKRTFIANAEKAQLFIVCGASENGSTAFLVERESPGLEISEKEDILGMRGAGVCNLTLKEVQIPEQNILGKEGEGEVITEKVLDFANMGIGAQGIGIGQFALEESVKYSKERKQFGRVICEFQLVQEMLADMETKIAAARLLVYDAALKCDADAPFTKEAALAKLCGTEAAMNAGIKGIQVHGGYGYTKDYPVERCFRDAKTAQIWGQTSEIQKIKIAKALLEQ